MRAQDGDVVARLEAAFADWAEQQGVTWGAIAILHDGMPVAATAFGRSPQDAVELASVSKSITAICALSLVMDGHLSWDDPVMRYVPDAPGGITLADLVTHTSGLVKDSTQGRMFGWLGSGEDYAVQVLDNIGRPGHRGRAGVSCTTMKTMRCWGWRLRLSRADRCRRNAPPARLSLRASLAHGRMRPGRFCPLAAGR
jgi:hypothetical protein